jgi:hypothetical protein
MHRRRTSLNTLLRLSQCALLGSSVTAWFGSLMTDVVALVSTIVIVDVLFIFFAAQFFSPGSLAMDVMRDVFTHRTLHCPGAISSKVDSSLCISLFGLLINKG